MRVVNYEKQVKRIETRDLWSLEAVYNGFQYWLPNDETHSIMAINHDLEIAVNTGFYEMDDFYDGSDYLVTMNKLNEPVAAFNV